MSSTRDRRPDDYTQAPQNPSYPVSPARPGQVVEGPAFYVWDEEPRRAREWGVELAEAWLARQPRQPR